jgi:hypothetical protein
MIVRSSPLLPLPFVSSLILAPMRIFLAVRLEFTDALQQFATVRPRLR